MIGLPGRSAWVWGVAVKRLTGTRETAGRIERDVWAYDLKARALRDWRELVGKRGLTAPVLAVPGGTCIAR